MQLSSSMPVVLKLTDMGFSNCKIQLTTSFITKLRKLNLIYNNILIQKINIGGQHVLLVQTNNKNKGQKGWRKRERRRQYLIHERSD